MTSRNRETLKNFFGEGMLPTKDHFGDLVDSMLNMTDEGFRKSARNGMEISAPVGHDALISFYRDQDPKSALWSIAYGGKADQLFFNGQRIAADDPGVPVLTLDAQARVGVNTREPRHTLDVAGVIGAQGRIGRLERSDAVPLLANGEWQDVTDPLTGCQAFEVMAGTGHQNTGHYALLRAIAMNTFNPRPGLFGLFAGKKRIHCQHAYYARRMDRLQLRWEGSSGRGASYRLQIRSRCDYGPQVRIQCFLTRLWFDEQMRESLP